MNNEIVSFEDEPLILVDSDDVVVGHADKNSCHNLPGQLHRAFSVFLFNEEGKLLLQQRAADKRLWGGYWANSCCSHPRQGEEMNEAAHRRTQQELGVSADIEHIFKFEYRAEFKDLGVEHELCSVFIGRLDKEPAPNPTEISATRWLDAETLHEQIDKSPDEFTPWLKLEWAQMRRDHWKKISGLWK